MVIALTAELQSLEVVEGLRTQEIGETVIYTITTTKSLSGPTSATVVATDEQDDTTVTTTLFTASNTPTVSGDVVTLKPCSGLTVNRTYRVKVGFTDGTSTHYTFFRILGVEI